MYYRNLPRLNRTQLQTSSMKSTLQTCRVIAIQTSCASMHRVLFSHLTFRLNKITCKSRSVTSLCIKAIGSLKARLSLSTSGCFSHANWIKMDGCDRQMIATQGPLEHTAGDFWRMIHQTEAQSILMLCQTMENNAPKCAQYFPLQTNETKTYGSMSVTLKSVRGFQVCECAPLLAFYRLSIGTQSPRQIPDLYARGAARKLLQRGVSLAPQLLRLARPQRAGERHGGSSPHQSTTYGEHNLIMQCIMSSIQSPY